MDIKLGKRLAWQVPVTDLDGTPKLDDKGVPVVTSVVEMLAIKPGQCDLFYTDKDGVHPMTVVEPKPIPSAD